MKLHIDTQADALYLRFDETVQIAESEEVAPGVVLDFDAAGTVVGVEVLRVSERVPSADLRAVQVETV